MARALPCTPRRGTPFRRSRLTAWIGLSISERDAAAAPICERLDGILLAIELAAGQFRLMSAPEFLAELDDRFRLLVGGNRTALPRHQTLRAALDWELRPPERRGPNALPAASSGHILELVGALVDQSLFGYRGAAVGSVPLVRQYAGQKLVAAGDAEAVRERHLDHYFALAEASEAELAQPKQLDWLDRLNSEIGICGQRSNGRVRPIRGRDW